MNGICKRTLYYQLGSAPEHTVFEAELVGVLLALYLLRTAIHSPISKATIGLDNQAALKAALDQSSKPAQYLIDHIHDLAIDLMKTQDHLHHPVAGRPPEWTPRTRKVINLSLHWTPGHVDFEENEEVDTEAKAAAQGKSSLPKDLPRVLRKAPLPRSLSAARQHHTAYLNTCWQFNWKKSRRYANRLHLIDPSLPSPKYLKAIDNLTRSQAAVITQLRIGHAPLNGHLFCIRRAISPYCPHCGPGTIETVRHFLIECRYYRVAHSRLEDKFR